MATQNQSAEVGRIAAQGAFWLGLTQVVRLFLTFGATVIVARLLTPSDYGVIAMTAPLFALVNMLQDLGLGAATIQARNLSHNQSTGLFWANTLATIVLALIVLCLSPLVGLFYHDARPAHVAAAGAIVIVVGGIVLQHSALLAREMRFRTVAILEISGLVATYGVTLTLAILIRNFWALFFGTLAGVALQSVLTWSASPFRPGRPHLKDIGELARFGGHVTGFNFLNFLVRNLDTVLVARFSGAAEAGMYDRSYKLLLLPLNSLAGPLSRLLQPILRDLRNEPERYRLIFNMALRGLGLVMIPPMAVTAVLAGPFMVLLLGPEWTEAGRVYFWLALVGMAQPVSHPTGLLYLTSGRARDFMRWGVVSSSVNILLFLAAAPYGARAMAFAFFCSSVLLMPLRFGYAAQNTPVPASDLYSAQFLPLIGAGAVALLTYFLRDKVPFLPLLIAGIALAYAAAVASTGITRRGRAINADLFNYLRRHVPAMVRR